MHPLGSLRTVVVRFFPAAHTLCLCSIVAYKLVCNDTVAVNSGIDRGWGLFRKQLPIVSEPLVHTFQCVVKIIKFLYTIVPHVQAHCYARFRHNSFNTEWYMAYTT